MDPPVHVFFCLFHLRDFSSFAALKTFPALETQYGMHTMFVCHGFITYASCVAVFLLMPETKGLTLTELTEIWSGGKNDKECRSSPNH